MALFAIADTHLSIDKDKPMDVFGNRWNGYLQKLEDRWRKTVGNEDTVVIPGDFSWGMSLEEAKPDFLYLDSLPGKKIIGKGNHDYWWATAKRMQEFLNRENIQSVSFLHNNAYVLEGFTICGSRGWFVDESTAIHSEADYEKIVKREVARLEMSIKKGMEMQEGELLVFLHFPPVFRDYVCPEIVDVLLKYHIQRCWFGHIHGVYTMPQEYTYKGIVFSSIAADYLDFVPKRIC